MSEIPEAKGKVLKQIHPKVNTSYIAVMFPQTSSKGKNVARLN